MLLKKRTLSRDLLKRRYLRHRMEFSEEDKKNYYNDEKGFEGELKFDSLIQQLPEANWLILSDLLFERNHSHFQIDSLLFSQYKLYLFEIKNYEGEFYVEGDRWYSMSRVEIKNPIHQLRRIETLLKPLLKSLGCHLPIESYVVFVNPEFTLFQAPLKQPILLPSQLSQYLKNLNALLTNPTQNLDLANQLIKRHLNKSPFSKVPAYDYVQLEKGISCCSCGRLQLHYKESGRFVVCKLCAFKERIEDAIMRTVKEFVSLFPHEKVTVSVVRDWIRLDISNRQIAWILNKNLKLFSNGRHSFYTF